MTRSIFARLIIDVLLAVAVVEGWWFVAIPLGILSVWVFPYFIESIIAGFAYDALYGLHGQGVLTYAGTIASLLVYVIFGGLKRIVRK